MSRSRNKHGLTRNIPAVVKLQVRQECGFGCVICGASLIEYEHIDPPFEDAQLHDASAIALLCSSCHSNVTRKFWSKDKVKLARSSPRCRSDGFSWGGLDLGSESPVIHFAGVTFRNCPVPIAVKGMPVLEIESPTIAGSPFLLSARFFGESGRQLFRIDKNEWNSTSGVWDTKFEAGRIEISEAKGSQQLVLRALPGSGLAVEKLWMNVRGYWLFGDVDGLEIVSPQGQRLHLQKCHIDGCKIGIDIS